MERITATIHEVALRQNIDVVRDGRHLMDNPPELYRRAGVHNVFAVAWANYTAKARVEHQRADGFDAFTEKWKAHQRTGEATV